MHKEHQEYPGKNSLLKVKNLAIDLRSYYTIIRSILQYGFNTWSNQNQKTMHNRITPSTKDTKMKNLSLSIGYLLLRRLPVPEIVFTTLGWRSLSSMIVRSLQMKFATLEYNSLSLEWRSLSLQDGSLSLNYGPLT